MSIVKQPLVRQQELNFIAFERSYLTPLKNLIQTSLLQTSADSKHFSNIIGLSTSAALLESIGWTSLGAAVGHFREVDALTLCTKFYSPDLDAFCRALESRFDSEWLELFRAGGRFE